MAGASAGSMAGGPPCPTLRPARRTALRADGRARARPGRDHEHDDEPDHNDVDHELDDEHHDDAGAPVGPTFGAPPSLAPALAATGWDHCSTASNHSIDRGTRGIDSTIDALEAAGITHAGTARTPDEAARITIRDINGIRVALLSATYGLNGLRTPKGEAWRVERIQVDRLVALTRIARAQGAAVVVLSLHWGQEYRHRPTPEQRAIARAVTASGAVDLIVGHHAHVVQPIEQVNGTWVVFGLGNHLSGQVPVGPKLATQDGQLAEVTVRDDPSGRLVVDRPVGHPTWNDPVTRVVHVAADLPGRRAAIASAVRTRAVLAGGRADAP